jgi:hypothetical protein
MSMAELELYGKCKELGYCDCGGFFGCIGTPALALVECSVCDRSHSPEHPHIKNIDGDVPIDDAELEETRPTLTEIPRQLPDWLKDKPGAVMIRPGTSSEPQELCQVCGQPWAPRHACKVKENPGDRVQRPDTGHL